MCADAVASGDKVVKYEWMWKYNLGPPLKDPKHEWRYYSDVENSIIEKAYSSEKLRAVLDAYSIDFERGIQISNDSSNKQRPVKRVPIKREETRLREARFMFHSTELEPTLSGQYGWVPPFIIAARMSLNLSVAQLPSNDKSIVAMIVEKAALGIIAEGKSVGKIVVAQNMAETLKSKKNEDIKIIWQCCAHMYSQEEFLYKHINEIMRYVGQKEKDDIWHSKVHTLGPFCLLLWDNPFSNRLTKGITLYRGANLNQEQIKTYETLVSHPNEYHSFQAFTSCSRKRELAQNYGNVLFIMYVLYAFTYDLRNVSEYPEEEEELISPGVNFRVQRVESDPKTNKKLIYLELRQRFNRKFARRFQTF
jgi:hypothetical protein